MNAPNDNSLPGRFTEESISNIQNALCSAFVWEEYPPTKPMATWAQVWGELEMLLWKLRTKRLCTIDKNEV